MEAELSHWTAIDVGAETRRLMCIYRDTEVVSEARALMRRFLGGASLYCLTLHMWICKLLTCKQGCVDFYCCVKFVSQNCSTCARLQRSYVPLVWLLGKSLNHLVSVPVFIKD